MGPKPGTTHHADVPQRLLSEPLPITDRARVARRDRRGYTIVIAHQGGTTSRGCQCALAMRALPVSHWQGLQVLPLEQLGAYVFESGYGR